MSNVFVVESDSSRLLFDLNGNKNVQNSSSIRRVSSSTQEMISDVSGEFVTVGSTSAVFVVPELKATSVPIRSLFRPSGLCRSVDGDLRMYRSDDDSNEETTYTSDMFIERATFGGAARDAEDAEFSTGWDSLARERFVARLGIRSVWEYNATESSDTERSSSAFEYTPLNWSQIEDTWPAVFLDIRPKETSREKIVGLPLRISTPKPESEYQHLNETTPSRRLSRMTKEERLVFDVTTDDATQPDLSKIKELCRLSLNDDFYEKMINLLWERILNDNQAAPYRVYKGLMLLSYLLQYGNKESINSSKDHMLQLSSLAHDYYIVTDDGQDLDKHVRASAAEILMYTQDDELTAAIRKNAEYGCEATAGTGFSASLSETSANPSLMNPTFDKTRISDLSDNSEIMSNASPRVQKEEHSISHISSQIKSLRSPPASPRKMDPFGDIDPFAYFHSLAILPPKKPTSMKAATVLDAPGDGSQRRLAHETSPILTAALMSTAEVTTNASDTAGVTAEDSVEDHAVNDGFNK